VFFWTDKEEIIIVIKKLLLAPIVAGCLLTTSVYAQSSVVKTIDFDGLQRVAKGAVLLNLPIHVGDRIDKKEISDAIKSLYATKNFEDIQVYFDQGNLKFVLKERPTIATISFSGNKSIKDKQLTENLKSSGVQVGESLDRTKLNEIEKALENFYYSVGKYTATVKAVVTPLPRNRTDLRFVFVEGTSAKIKQINITGNKTFSDKELTRRLSLSDDVAWYDIFSNEKYQKQLLASDLETIKSFYLNRGYIKFRIKDAQVSISPDKNQVYINIAVDEGQQYRIKDIKLRGSLAGNEKEFDSLMAVEPLEIYNAAKITQAEERLKKLLGRAGYAYPKVKTYPQVDDDKREVSLLVNVEPGQRYYVRKILFAGNTTTKDEVLRREMRQMEGAWLNMDDVNQGKRRLNRLGYFSTVKMDTRRVPGSKDQVDVFYTVQEANAGSINFGIGYGTSSGMTYQVGLTQSNFLGTGDSFNISAVKNDYSETVSIGATNPYFTLDGVSLGGRLFYKNYDADDDDTSSYTSKSFGGSTTLGAPYSEDVSFSTSLGYTHTKIEDLEDYVQYDTFLDEIGSSGADEFSVDDFYVSLGWKYSTLDKGYFPTEGTYQRASLKVVTPGSATTYFKSQYDIRHYIPLNKDRSFVLLMRGRIGYGDGYGSDTVMPFYDNFYAGGFSTIRGFSSNTVSPKSVTDNGDGTYSVDNDYSVGGNAIALASVELFFPNPFASDDGKVSTVRTSVFVDSGSVWDTHFDYDSYKDNLDSSSDTLYDYSDPMNVRVSSGLALQWQSPMGNLVFSVAESIKTYSGDDEEFFTFSVGQNF